MVSRAFGGSDGFFLGRCCTFPAGTRLRAPLWRGAFCERRISPEGVLTATPVARQDQLLACVVLESHVELGAATLPAGLGR